MLVIRRKVYDEYNDEEVELTKEEIDMIRRLRQGKIPHAEVNPYEVRNIGRHCLYLHSSGKNDLKEKSRILYYILIGKYLVVQFGTWSLH